MPKRLAQVRYKKRYSGSLHAHVAESELGVERSAKERRLITDGNQPAVVG
jgi:hypothetical protein